MVDPKSSELDAVPAPDPDQTVEDALYAQKLFQATPAEASPADQDASSQPN